MKTTLRFLLTVALFAAMAFTLSACGGDDGGDPAVDPSSSGGEDVTLSSSGGGVGVSSSSVYVGTGGKGNDIANYKTKTIGTQVWMAENLDYNVSGNKCYDNSDSNCDIYGRLYDWATAMDLPSSCNFSTCASQVSAKHRGICPAGWHIPTNAEWNELYHYADGTLTVSTNLSSNYGSPSAGRYLKAASGWNWNDWDNISGNGLDTYGFAALPGGSGLW